MSSVLRSVFAFALVSATFALVAPGCSEQAQGERCDHDKNGDLDCENGLECIPGNLLLAEDSTGRCCPEPGTETDKRCTRKTGGTDTGTGGTDAGTGGTSSAGTSSAGTSSAGTSSAGTDAAGGTPTAEAGAAGQAG